MEAPDCFHAGCDHDSSPEKLGKEHFIVDDLLDFSNEEDDDDQAIVGVGDETGSSSDSTAGTNSSISNFPCDIDCQGFGDGAALCGDLCEPYEELAELEWLSNFVEESFASDDLEKLHLISGVQPSSSSFSPPRTKAGDDHAGDTNIFLPEAQVPVKARSKRPRATASTWSSRLLVLSPTTSSSCESELLVPINTNASKKPAKKRKETSEGATFAASDGRKCLHCATDKTPQWRTGPMGPKTLCNACGVRYKSGRLVPEYRPAASPTFVVSKHSNSHRKVLELRRQKEMQHQQQQLARLGMLCEAPAAAGADAGDEFLIDRPIVVDFEQLV